MSEAVAVTVIVPDTVALLDGAVTLTMGTWVSETAVAAASFEGWLTLPDASSAVTR